MNVFIQPLQPHDSTQTFDEFDTCLIKAHYMLILAVVEIVSKINF